jgi:fatty-acyl-CoA synthase
MSGQPGSPPTYVHRILDVFAANGDREALVNGSRRITYAEARSLVLQIAEAFRRSGLKKGDKIAIAAGNTAEVVLVQLAVHVIGAMLIFVPAEPVPQERAAFLLRAAPDALVFDELYGQGPELARLAGPPLVFSVGPAEEGQDLLALAARMPATPIGDEVTAADIQAVFYTGGTTGHPKMVLHRHNYYDSLLFAAGRRKAESEVPQRFLLCTTVNHGSGQMTTIMALLAGGTLLLMDRFDAGLAIKTLLSENATSIMLHPVMLNDVLDHPDFPADGFPSLIRVYYGGAPTAPARLRQAIERFGPIMRQTYALTEVSLVTLMEPAEHDLSIPGRLSSCGRPLPQMAEVAVLGEDLTPVPQGEIGEVCVRGKTIMAEYWQDPEITAETFRGGWFHTGDAGYFDADGYLFLVDRIKDVICTGNPMSNVYTKLLDDLLAEQPGVHAAAAVGIPDEHYGEVIHAALVADPGTVDTAALSKHVLDVLGPLYVPEAIVFMDSLPWTRVGKVDKKALRATLTATAAAAQSTEE